MYVFWQQSGYMRRVWLAYVGLSADLRLIIPWRIVMMRRGIKGWSSNVYARPDASENRVSKDHASPYRELRKVPLAEKAKAFRNKLS